MILFASIGLYIAVKIFGYCEADRGCGFLLRIRVLFVAARLCGLDDKVKVYDANYYDDYRKRGEYLLRIYVFEEEEFVSVFLHVSDERTDGKSGKKSRKAYDGVLNGKRARASVSRNEIVYEIYDTAVDACHTERIYNHKN